MKTRTLAILGCCLLLAASSARAASPGREALDRGTELYKNGRYAEAVEAFKEATRLDPGLLKAWENLGWAYHRSGKHAEAMETWRTVLKVEPKRIDLLNEIGAIQLGDGRWNEAAEMLQRSLALDPSQAKVRLRLADASEKGGRLRDAEAQFREVLRQHPADFDAILRLQEFLERNGREGDALALMRDVAPRVGPYRHVLDVRSARLLARRGDIAYKSGNYKDALAAYKDAVAADPDNAQYRINQGWAHRQLGDLPAAAASWRAALERDPGKTALYRHVADAAFEQEDLRTAAAMYGRAWASAERQPSVPYRLAQISLEEGKTDDAVHWLQELFALPDGDAEWSRRVASLFAGAEQADLGIRFFRGRMKVSRQPVETGRALAKLHAFQGSVAFQAGQNEAAMRELEQAVALDPKSPQALRDLGWVYWATEHWDECADIWGRYAAAYPDEPQPHNLMTHLHLKRKEYAAAVTSARTSLRLDPAQPLQKLKLARALFANSQYDEGRRLAEAVAKENPDDVNAQVFWAELLMQYHDFARGKPQWQRVRELGVRTPKSEYFLVFSMYELGEYDAALQQARRILDEEGPKQPLYQFLVDDAVVRGDNAEAVKWYRLMVQSFPERLAAWLELSRLQQETGDVAGARATLVQAKQHHADRIDLLLAEADLLRRAGRADEARAAYAAIHAAHPSHRDAYNGLLQTSLESGRSAEALTVLHAGQGTFMKPYEARLQEARILFAMGREGEAQRSLVGVADPVRGEAYVPILLYHGLGDHPRSATMPVALFDSQMRALHDQGFTAITVSELSRMLDGKLRFPERPILVTFDDARLDSFERADPVLERYGMKATMFVPSGRILDGHPFFADWKRIRSFVEGGRFELQSHGHFAHDPIVVDETGTQGSFLVNREWEPEMRRLESYDEYRARLDEDYVRSIREITSRFKGAEVVGYAFPFSEAGQENVGNEPRAAETNQELLAGHFRFGFIQDPSGYNALSTGSSGTLMLRRFGVPRDYDGEALLRHLAREDPRDAALAQSARMLYWSGDYDRSRKAWEQILGDQPRLQGEASYYLAAIQFQRGRYDEARRHLRAAESAQFQRLRSESGLVQRIRWQTSGRIEPRYEYFSDADGRETLWSGVEVQAGPLGPLDASFSVGKLDLRQEGFSPLSGPELAAAARLGPFVHWTFEGRAWQRSLEGAPDTLSFQGGLGFDNDWLRLRVRAGHEDVNTLLARAAGIQADTAFGQATIRFSPSVLGFLDAGLARLEDGNDRQDFTGKLIVRPRWGHGFGFGAAGGWSDTTFQSPLYYSPEELRYARGLLSYQGQWGGGWFLESELGLGMATDAIHGDRRILHAAGRTGQAWGDRLRTVLEGRYSNSPGYSSWNASAAIQVRVW